MYSSYLCHKMEIAINILFDTQVSWYILREFLYIVKY